MNIHSDEEQSCGWGTCLLVDAVVLRHRIMLQRLGVPRLNKSNGIRLQALRVRFTRVLLPLSYLSPSSSCLSHRLHHPSSNSAHPIVALLSTSACSAITALNKSPKAVHSYYSRSSSSPPPRSNLATNSTRPGGDIRFVD